MAARLSAILFDAGNTLVRIDYAAIAAHLTARGLRVSVEAIEDAELRARVLLDAELGGRSTESGDTQGRYFGLVLERLGITAAAELDAIAAWRRAHNPPLGPWCVAEPLATGALRRARAAGLRTGVISNSNGHIRRILRMLELLDDVDVVIDSGEVGVEKPDPRIFRIALDAAGVAPEAAAYVGDLYTVDVLGARAAGLEAVLIDPRGYWGPRDCLRALDVAHAVALLLGSADQGGDETTPPLGPEPSRPVSEIR